MKITIVEMEPQEFRDLLIANSIEEETTVSVRSTRRASGKEIREWAKSKGLAISSRGYPPKDVVEAFYSENV